MMCFAIYIYMANEYQENKASKPTPMYIESSVIILFIYECVELYTLGIYSIVQYMYSCTRMIPTYCPKKPVPKTSLQDTCDSSSRIALASICSSSFNKRIHSPKLTYCWWVRNPTNQLRLVVYPHYLPGFIQDFWTINSGTRWRRPGQQNKTHLPTPVFQWGGRVILDCWISQLVDLAGHHECSDILVMKLKVCGLLIQSYSIYSLPVGSMYGIFTYTFSWFLW